MCYHPYGLGRLRLAGRPDGVADGRLVTDGGTPDESGADDADDGTKSTGGDDSSGDDEVEEAEPAEPQWVEPDLEDLPEFELGADQPVVQGGQGDPGTAAGGPGASGGGGGSPDPTSGMPNAARSPDATRISPEATEAYIVAFELCARLPDDVRLPEEAAELVPAAVEAELEQDIQSFAAAEFDTQTPHVDVLRFVEIDDEIWLRLRVGVPREGFEDLDPDEIRSYALQQLEGVF